MWRHAAFFPEACRPARDAGPGGADADLQGTALPGGACAILAGAPRPPGEARGREPARTSVVPGEVAHVRLDLPSPAEAPPAPAWTAFFGSFAEVGGGMLGGGMLGGGREMGGGVVSPRRVAPPPDEAPCSVLEGVLAARALAHPACTGCLLGDPIVVHGEGGAATVYVLAYVPAGLWRSPGAPLRLRVTATCEGDADAPPPNRHSHTLESEALRVAMPLRISSRASWLGEGRGCAIGVRICYTGGGESGSPPLGGSVTVLGVRAIRLDDEWGGDVQREEDGSPAHSPETLGPDEVLSAVRIVRGAVGSGDTSGDLTVCVDVSMDVSSAHTISFLSRPSPSPPPPRNL